MKILCAIVVSLCFASLGFAETARGSKDEKSSLKYAQEACEGKLGAGGIGNGCFLLGEMYEKGNGVQQDDVKAAELYKKACNNKNMKGCGSLGYMYKAGRGVKKDYPKAAELYERACNGGNGGACWRLSRMYGKPLGSWDKEELKQDCNKAVELLEKAWELGEAEAYNDLGLIYRSGCGIGKDYIKAADILLQACNAGRETSCNNLIYMYQANQLKFNQGKINELYMKLADIYRKSCDSGDDRALFNCKELGEMYEKGQGIQRDYVEALNLYRKACDMGNQTACENYAKLKKQLGW